MKKAPEFSDQATAEASDRHQSLAWALGVGILLLALLLRGWRLGDMEFKYDEVAVLQLTQEWLGRGIPSYGMLSGVGVRNPPGFIFMLWPWVAGGASPLIIAWGMVLLQVATVGLVLLLGHMLGRPALGRWGAAFYAVHPWLILYGRKLWAQSALPFFVVLVLLVLAHHQRRPRSRLVFVLPPLLAFAWQVHFSAWCLVGLVALWGAVAALRRRINWAWLLAGALPALLILAPYLVYLAGNGFADLRAQASVGAGDGGWENLCRVARTFSQAAFAGGFGQVNATDPSPLTRVVPGTVGIALEALACCGSAGILVLAVAGVRARRRDMASAPTQSLCVCLAIAALLPPMLYALRGIRTPPHYFIIGLPALLLLAANGLLALPRFARRLVGGALLATGVAIWLTALGQVHRDGGTAGDYGVAYRHQRAAAEFLAHAGVRGSDVDASRMRDAGIGVHFLVDRLLPESPSHATGAAIVVDTLRAPQMAGAPFAPGWRETRIGPLRVGLAPPETAAGLDL